jgi:hypothetical protein
MGVIGQQHPAAVVYPRERLGTYCTGGWVGPRAGLDSCGKSRRTGIRSPDRPARSSVDIPTELSGPSVSYVTKQFIYIRFMLRTFHGVGD